MSKKDKEIFDSYASGNPNQRFELIYKNYHTFPKLIDSFETGVFNMILNEREYNRRAKNKADLGVRVQTSNKSDPTAKLAVERVMIREAIEKCDLDGGILKDTDNPEKHKKAIWTITMMRREYEVFDSFLNTLDGREYTIMTRHLNEKCTAAKIAEELKIADKTVSNQLSEIKCSLRENITPYFREAI